jgi:hypothetical protein
MTAAAIKNWLIVNVHKPKIVLTAGIKATNKTKIAAVINEMLNALFLNKFLYLKILFIF